MAKSRTKIKYQIRRKTNPEIIEAVRLAMKHKPWAKVLEMMSGPKSNYNSLNLLQIDKNTSTGDTVLIIGKVLSLGSISKKLRICALSISAKAREKLNKAGATVILLTHDREIVNKLGKRVITLVGGKIIRDETEGRFIL